MRPRRLKIGDKILYTPWGGGKRSATVEGIELTTEKSPKYGRPVQSVNLDRTFNAVLDLSDGHWIYITQVKYILKSVSR